MNVYILKPENDARINLKKIPTPEHPERRTKAQYHEIVIEGSNKQPARCSQRRKLGRWGVEGRNMHKNQCININLTNINKYGIM